MVGSLHCWKGSPDLYHLPVPCDYCRCESLGALNCVVESLGESSDLFTNVYGFVWRANLYVMYEDRPTSLLGYIPLSLVTSLSPWLLTSLLGYLLLSLVTSLSPWLRPSLLGYFSLSIVTSLLASTYRTTTSHVSTPSEELDWWRCILITCSYSKER